MLRFGIVDDDVAFQQRFKSYLELTNEFDLVLQASSVEEAIQQLKHQTTTIEILFLDVLMPEVTGLQGLPKLRRLLPESEIIMLTVLEDSESLIKALTLGANGYLLKETQMEEMIAQIGIIKQGGAVMSPKMARKLIGYFSPQAFEDNGVLTKRNLQVLQMLADGYNYKTISAKLDMTIDGVRFHIKQIYRVLNVQSAAQAVKKYLEGDLPLKQK